MTIKRVLAGFAVSSLAVGLAAGVATPASAASWTKCSAVQSKEFPTSGFDADVRITMCITKWTGGSGGQTLYTRAYANVSWGDSGDDKFEKFDLQVRLEQNDRVITSRTCALARTLDSTSGSTTCSVDGPLNSGANSSDGKVTYNINDDGLGDRAPWELGGSPLLNI
ncbi:hypothetical protein GCM10027589_35410 [Actinocorallia lasiicapitis]